jgi:hypothetical protein
MGLSALIWFCRILGQDLVCLRTRGVIRQPHVQCPNGSSAPSKGQALTVHEALH